MKVRPWDRSWGGEYIAASKLGSTSAMTTADNFLKRGRVVTGNRILELGAGHGRITDAMVGLTSDLEVVAVDLTLDLLREFVLRAGTNGCSLARAQLNLQVGSIPFRDDSFDAVVSARVFHYLDDPVGVLREAHRVVRRHGRVVISVPNKLNPIKGLTYRRAQLYTPRQVATWFEHTGFRDIKIGTMSFFPSTQIWRRLATAAEKVGHAPGLRWFGGSVVVAGTK